MKIVLIGNYQPDKQESMKLFCAMLYKGFISAGIESEIWLPPVFFGAFSKSTNKGVGKWLGYLDKWMVFPIIVKMRLLKKKYNNPGTRFHICDHSNAPYLTFLPLSKVAITCHDVLAIRGAFGFKDAYCTATRFGVVLQKWILKNLITAEKLATVSDLTLRQLRELSNGSSLKKDWQVIHNSFNEHFAPVSSMVADEKIKTMGLPTDLPFLLHVGSSLKRKNRKLLVDMLFKLGNNWNGMVWFAGEEIDSELSSHISKLGLQNRVKSIVKPSHENLLALYSSCAAFIFPSFSEGFGWPLIEAQACGAPVITSNIEPMPEISGGAALYGDPDKAAEFAKAFLTLQNISIREQLVEDGFKNCQRFAAEKMIDAYLLLHHFKENNRVS